MAGAQHARQNRLRLGAHPRAVAAPDFAVDHRRAKRAFGPVVRRFCLRSAQKGEPFVANRKGAATRFDPVMMTRGS